MLVLQSDMQGSLLHWYGTHRTHIVGVARIVAIVARHLAFSARVTSLKLRFWDGLGAEVLADGVHLCAVFEQQGTSPDIAELTCNMKAGLSHVSIVSAFIVYP